MSKTDFSDYSENNYGKKARITDAVYRDALTSWQVPAIKTHMGDLTGKVFLDIGAGDIVLGEKLHEIGVPKKFYVQDLSEPSISSGLERLVAAGIDTSIFQSLISSDFSFDSIEDEEVDFAFSNSLFSHLSLNSILLCLRHLSSKMQSGKSYFSSMIVLPNDIEALDYDWSYMNKLGTNVVSYAIKDPFHYTDSTIRNLLNFRTGFEVKAIHDYGHPFQKLVEFIRV